MASSHLLKSPSNVNGEFNMDNFGNMPRTNGPSELLAETCLILTPLMAGGECLFSSFYFQVMSSYPTE